MKLLLKNVTVCDPTSDLNGKKTDILLNNGTIEKTGNIPEEKDFEIISEGGLFISPGWFDMQVNFRDPGNEYKEDLISGSEAAKSGGFTDVAVMPGTTPPLHSKSEIEYVKNKAKGLPVNIHPVGCITHNLDGKEIAEMYDMHLSGAVAFSDDKKPVSNSGLLSRALLYTKSFNGLIMTHCEDKSVSADGKMNEGPESTMLGMKGIPGLAEEIMVSRNIHLAKYTGCRIHLSSISTAGSVELIRKAKKENIEVTCSVNAHHLFFDDSLLRDFDTNLKVNPPLRNEADIKVLYEGILDGTIDVITSDHNPEDIENKAVEFDHASFGMIGTQHVFSMLKSSDFKFDNEILIKALSHNPRKILGLPAQSIKSGNQVSLTLFFPDQEYRYDEKENRSKSKNTPLGGRTLKGKVFGILNKGKFYKA